MREEGKKGRPYASGKPKKINVSVRFDEDEHKELAIYQIFNRQKQIKKDRKCIYDLTVNKVHFSI